MTHKRFFTPLGNPFPNLSPSLHSQATTDQLFQYSLHFFRVLYKRNNKIIHSLIWICSLRINIFRFIHVILCINYPLLLIIELYPIVCVLWLYYGLPIHPIMDIWIVSNLWILHIKLQWTFKSLYAYNIFILGKYLGLECLCHIVNKFLTL